MYDNIDFTLYSNRVPGTDLLKVVPPCLTTLTSSGVNQFGEYVTGYLDSLKVSISESRLRVYDSSLCKYYLGDNFKTLSKGDTRRSIEKISDSLHLPFNLATVTRIDIAKNIILQYETGVYLPYLGEAQYYKRLEQNNGLYYNNKIRQLCFYGKVYEQKEKRQPIPELYTGRNVLRYEMRYRKRICKQLKQHEITAGLLSAEKFYYDLITRWRDEYNSIQKINSKIMNMQPTGSTKQFIETLAFFAISELGQPHLLSRVAEWLKTGAIKKKQAHDLRAMIKKLTSARHDEQGNDLINELNRKVKEASRY